MSNDATNEDSKKSRSRSPNHPVLSLPKAVERAQELHREYGMHAVPVATAHTKWGYKEHSGLGNQCIAALKAYGLLLAVGLAKNRKVELTERAVRIIRNAPNRRKMLREAAIDPSIHAEIMQEYSKKGIPPNEVLRNYLVWERPTARFNEDVVDAFIERFRETLEFAGLLSGDIIEHDGITDDDARHVKIGDFVQWTSQGVCQFFEAKRIAKIEKHTDGTEYAYFEEEGGYAPMSELTTEEPSAKFNLLKPQSNPPPPPGDRLTETPEGTAIERWTLDEGPASLTRPDNLSAESVLEFEHSVIGVLNRARRKAGMPRIKVEEAK